jgi:hypothetical protein
MAGKTPHRKMAGLSHANDLTVLSLAAHLNRVYLWVPQTMWDLINILVLMTETYMPRSELVPLSESHESWDHESNESLGLRTTRRSF